MMDNSERADELFAALQHLKFNKHEVVLFHVQDMLKRLPLITIIGLIVLLI